VLEAAALEVILELLPDIPRQDRAVSCQARLERGIVFLDKLIEEGVLRPMTRVHRRADTRTSALIERFHV
jgi:hypothetical protein